MEKKRAKEQAQNSPSTTDWRSRLSPLRIPNPSSHHHPLQLQTPTTNNNRRLYSLACSSRAAPPCGHSPPRRRRRTRERAPGPAAGPGPGRRRARCRSPTPSARRRRRPPSPSRSSPATPWARLWRSPSRCAGTGSRRWWRR